MAVTRAIRLDDLENEWRCSLVFSALSGGEEVGGPAVAQEKLRALEPAIFRQVLGRRRLVNVGAHGLIGNQRLGPRETVIRFHDKSDLVIEYAHVPHDDFELAVFAPDERILALAVLAAAGEIDQWVARMLTIRPLQAVGGSQPVFAVATDRRLAVFVFGGVPRFVIEPEFAARVLDQRRVGRTVVVTIQVMEGEKTGATVLRGTRETRSGANLALGSAGPMALATPALKVRRLAGWA